jgi:hypothetical protein
MEIIEVEKDLPNFSSWVQYKRHHGHKLEIETK